MRKNFKENKPKPRSTGIGIEVESLCRIRIMGKLALTPCVHFYHKITTQSQIHLSLDLFSWRSQLYTHLYFLLEVSKEVTISFPTIHTVIFGIRIFFFIPLCTSCPMLLISTHHFPLPLHTHEWHFTNY